MLRKLNEKKGLAQRVKEFLGGNRMPKSVTHWFCSTCGMEHKSEENAAKCEGSHYKIGNIIGVYYRDGRRAPEKIQVEVDIGNGEMEKDIFYVVSEDGWGAK